MLFTIKERWSDRELERQINASYYERVMLGNKKLATMSVVLKQDIINVFKDTYVLELLHLPEPYLEKDLRKAIAQNITKFLLEFGRDFALWEKNMPYRLETRTLQLT